MRHIVHLVLASALLWLSVVAVAAPVVTATWTAPTEGSEAVSYQLEVYGDGELLATFTAIEDTAFVLPAQIEAGVNYTARVRGVDIQDRVGPWSELGPGYIWNPTTPGACGTVVLSGSE
jgi:hypothetical protein